VAVKQVGPTDPVPVYLVPAYSTPGRPWHLVNLDQVNPVFYDDSPTVTLTSNLLNPLGSATFDGTSDVYCCTVGGPAVKVQTGIRGQRGWSAGPVSAAQQIQAFGIPPVVPNTLSASFIGQGAGGGGPFFTFSKAGHIWAVHLSFAAATNSSYTGGVTQLYARVKASTGTGLDLCVIELAVSGPNQNANGDGDLSMPGIPVAKNDQLILDPNNNVALTNGVMHASTVVLYSIP
jgi:hypothetical protein